MNTNISDMSSNPLKSKAVSTQEVTGSKVVTRDCRSSVTSGDYRQKLTTDNTKHAIPEIIFSQF